MVSTIIHAQTNEDKFEPRFQENKTTILQNNSFLKEDSLNSEVKNDENVNKDEKKQQILMNNVNPSIFFNKKFNKEEINHENEKKVEDNELHIETDMSENEIKTKENQEIFENELHNNEKQIQQKTNEIDQVYLIFF